LECDRLMRPEIVSQKLRSPVAPQGTLAPPIGCDEPGWIVTDPGGARGNGVGCHGLQECGAFWRDGFAVSMGTDRICPGCGACTVRPVFARGLMFVMALRICSKHRYAGRNRAAAAQVIHGCICCPCVPPWGRPTASVDPQRADAAGETRLLQRRVSASPVQSETGVGTGCWSSVI